MKLAKFLIGFVAFIALLLSFSTVVFAKTINQETVTVAEGETVREDLFAVGEKVEIAGIVEGDIYAAGGNVEISGTVFGDVIAAGGNVNVSGEVEGSVRAVGGSVNVNGFVGHSVSVAGGKVILGKEADVQGSFIAAGGEISVSGRVARDVRVHAEHIVFASQIGGNADASVGELTLSPTATVSGNLRYFSRSPAIFEKGATVSGEIVHDVPISPKPAFHIGLIAMLVAKLVFFLPIFVLGIFLLKIAPNSSRVLSDEVMAHPVRNFALGLAFFILALAVATVLAFTVVGLPLALILIFFLMLYLYVGFFSVTYALGRKVVPGQSDISQLLLGTVLLVLASLVPIVGHLALFIALYLGFASTVLGKRRIVMALRAKKLL